MKIKTTVMAIVTLTLISLLPIRAGWATGGMRVYVIAPSTAASAEARKIRQQNDWSETKDISTTDAVLVVVRSSRSNPLSGRYDSPAELAADAEDVLDAEGKKFHIYLFQRQDDSSVLQTRHIGYKAD